jgi:polyhydroxybutyrate depolymerase
LAVTPHVIDVNGVRRRLLVAEPTGEPSALVLSLHGSRSGPEQQARLSRMESLVGKGAVVAYPQGSLPSGSGSEWDLSADVAFLDAVVGFLRDRVGVADSRPLVTGMSGGARMASRFAALRPERVRLLGAVAGLRAPRPPHPGSPVRVVAFHGTSDRINPFGGGRGPRWDESVLDAARAWAQANGVGTDPRRDDVSHKLTRFTFGPDDGPGTVTLWVCAGAGHTWPGTRLSLPLRILLGPTSMQVDATAEIWRAAAVDGA